MMKFEVYVALYDYTPGVLAIFKQASCLLQWHYNHWRSTSLKPLLDINLKALYIIDLLWLAKI